MGVNKQYVDKQGIRSEIAEEVDVDLGIVIVIPAYKEKGIDSTLLSLLQCEKPACSVEVIVFINGKVTDTPEVTSINEACYHTCLRYVSNFEARGWGLFVLRDSSVSSKKAGVGLARKRLMDQAVMRFYQINRNGIIVNLDADCSVNRNYLVAINQFFLKNTNFDAASIHFEHQLGNDAILHYELHLRYFIGMQKLIKLPFAFQTIGSAMAVRCYAYAAQGGMNTRKAGEDFYFMHKFIKIDKCGRLASAIVYPSDRVSDRVPFGTGKAVGTFVTNGSFTTYNPNSFIAIEELATGLQDLYKGENIELHPTFVQYLDTIDFDSNLREIKENTRDFQSFKKRFYQFFDAFKLMKCLHFLRDNGIQNVTLDNALSYYTQRIGFVNKGISKEMLLDLRAFDLREGG